MKKDVYVKDEGSFATLIFQTEKAKTFAVNEGIVNHYAPIVGSEYKHDLDMVNVGKIKRILRTNGLTLESEL